MDSLNSNESFISSEITTLKPRSKHSENIFQLAAEEKVLNNPMLLEKILKYLIYNHNEKISQNMIQTARQVQKNWLKTTTNLLKRSVKPVIVLTLDEKNSLNESDEVKKNGKRLDKFTSIFKNPSRLQYSLLPFKLNLTLEYFRKENHKSLSDCLTHFAYALIEIQVAFPNDGGSMPIIFPPMSLPLLRELNFEFSAQIFQKLQGDEDVPSNDNNQNGLWFLQLILNASVNLKELTVPYTKRNDDLVPRNFELLVLPTSVTSIKLTVALKDKHLDVLLNNQLPNLKHLVIRVQKVPLENNKMFTILNHFRKTLISFQASGATVMCASCSSTVLKFPLMEKLETIRIASTKCELETENAVLYLHKVLPRVNNILLYYQTEDLLAKWLRSYRLENVNDLALSLVNHLLPRKHSNYFQSLSLEMIYQVHFTFPNVINLSLALNICDFTCLKYVFKNMRQLKSLSIDLKGNIREASKCYIDSIFLGFPLQLVESLRDHAEFSHSVKLNQDREPSILNLSKLSVLTLRTSQLPAVPGHIRPINDEAPVLSDLLFTAGLLNMPKLLKINLIGTFQISNKILNMWSREGRQIIRF